MFLIYPIYLTKIGINPIYIGMLMSLFYLANMAVRPVGSTILEILSIRKAAWLTFLLLLISSIGLTFSIDPKLIGLCRLLGGLGYGIGTVSLTAYQSLIVPERIRGGAFAWISVFYVSPQLLFVPIASYFLKTNRDVLYLLMFSLFSILFLLTALFLTDIKNIKIEDDNSKNSIVWGSYRELFRVRGIFTYIISILAFSMINGTILMYVSSLSNEKGLNPSLFLSTNASVALMIRIAGNRIMNQLNRYRWLGISLLSMAISTFLLGYSSNSIHLVLLSLTYGSGMAISFPFLLAIASDITPISLRPKASAVAWIMMDLGYILAPLIIGFTSSTRDISYSFKFISLLLLPIILLVSFLWRRFLRFRSL